MVFWLICWQPVLLWRLLSVVRALVREILRLIMHSVSVIQPETSRTVKVPRSRMVRFLLLHLWMRVLSQQQQQTKASWLRQKITLVVIQDRSISLTRLFMRTVSLTARVLQIRVLRFSLVRTLRTGQRWQHCRRIWSWKLFLRFMIRLPLQMSWSRPVRLLLIVPTRLDWLSLHFPERIRLMWDVRKRFRKHRKQFRKVNVRWMHFRRWNRLWMWLRNLIRM